MGACSSCLGGRRGSESLDAESSRLLEDDIYQANYGYGALNQAHRSDVPDPEDLKREREALESICQRTSDSVIDIWSLHSQPHLQPRAALRSSISTSDFHAGETGTETTSTTRPSKSTLARSNQQSTAMGATMPKHWGEVVIKARKKRSRPGINTSEDNGRDVFGVLKVT